MNYMYIIFAITLMAPYIIIYLDIHVSRDLHMLDFPRIYVSSFTGWYYGNTENIIENTM